MAERHPSGSRLDHRLGYVPSYPVAGGGFQQLRERVALLQAVLTLDGREHIFQLTPFEEEANRPMLMQLTSQGEDTGSGQAIAPVSFKGTQQVRGRICLKARCSCRIALGTMPDAHERRNSSIACLSWPPVV